MENNESVQDILATGLNKNLIAILRYFLITLLYTFLFILVYIGKLSASHFEYLCYISIVALVGNIAKDKFQLRRSS